eukprot:SAG11_NODE_18611_length_486_cov_0.643411_1_plen_25_part_10
MKSFEVVGQVCGFLFLSEAATTDQY